MEIASSTWGVVTFWDASARVASGTPRQDQTEASPKVGLASTRNRRGPAAKVC